MCRWSIPPTTASRSAGLPTPIRPAIRDAGLLSQASFTTLWSPSGRTSPTVRGKALRQNILCEKVPPPPGNVSFKFVEDTSNPQFKTTRDRLTAHRTEPMCAGCHKLTDPIGPGAGELRFGRRVSHHRERGGDRCERGAQRQAVRRCRRAWRRRCTMIRRRSSCVAQRAFAFETGYLPPKDDPRWQADSAEVCRESLRCARAAARDCAERSVVPPERAPKSRWPRALGLSRQERTHEVQDEALDTPPSARRGMLAGSAVTVGLPILDCVLNENGTAFADTGAPLPTRFVSWFWPLGIGEQEWRPKTCRQQTTSCPGRWPRSSPSRSD